MPRRHRLLFVALAAVVVGLAVGVWAVWPENPPTAITCENAAKIKKGMTLAEVEALLGGPSRSKKIDRNRAIEGSSDPRIAQESQARMYRFVAKAHANQGKALSWWSDYAIVFVALDANAAVEDCESFRVVPTDEGPLDWARRWLGL